MDILEGEEAVASPICQGGARRGMQAACTMPHEPLEGEAGEQHGCGGEVMMWQQPATALTKNAHSVEEELGAGCETM
jgi:hypothetical protein